MAPKKSRTFMFCRDGSYFYAGLQTFLIAWKSFLEAKEAIYSIAIFLKKILLIFSQKKLDPD
jgi:hypothetical protein